MRRLLELQTLFVLINFLALACLSTSFIYTAPGGRRRCQRQHPTNTVFAWRRSTGSAFRPNTSCSDALDSVAEQSHGRELSLRSSKEDDDPSFDQDAEDQDVRLLARFLGSFWKGITLPFPALRRISLRPDFTDTATATTNNNNNNNKLSVGLTFAQSASYLAAYLAMGVLSYHLVLEKWSIVDSLYFTCTCFSTVGYGDLCPTNAASKIFTCAFGLGGIAFLGAALATVGGSFVQAEIKTAEKARDKSQRRLMQMFEGMPKTVSRFRNQSHTVQQALLKSGTRYRKTSLKGKKFTQRFARPQNCFRNAKKIFLGALPSLTIILGGGAIMRELNGGGPWIDALYFSLITGKWPSTGADVPVV
jgi:hypothetical protein